MPRALKISSHSSAGRKKHIKFPTKHTQRTDQDSVCLWELPTIWIFCRLTGQGNRRFAPVLVHPERVEKHILANEKEAREYIRQAWAEAMVLYRNGFHELKLSRSTEEYLKEMQKEFMPGDAEVGIIQLWLDELSKDYVCSIMIYKKAFHHEYDTPKDWELKEINNVMNHSIVGWEKVSSHRFVGYGTQRGWRRVTDKNGFRKLPENVSTPFEEIKE